MRCKYFFAPHNKNRKEGESSCGFYVQKESSNVVDKESETAIFVQTYWMKRFSFTSISYSTTSFNIAMLLLRISFGVILMVSHGFAKLRHFDQLQSTFYSFMGMGPKASLILALFAEVFCSLLIVLGLFTRWACIPLIITMLVVIYGANAGKDFLDSELAIAYLVAFVTLILCGPGSISVDGMISKK